MEMWYNEDRIAYLKAESCLADLMYILRIPFEEKDFTKAVKKSFENGVKKFTELIGYLQVSSPWPLISYKPNNTPSKCQDADKFLHKKGEHVEFEPREWEFVGKMIASLAGVSAQIHRWCTKDKDALVSSTK